MIIGPFILALLLINGLFNPFFFIPFSLLLLVLCIRHKKRTPIYLFVSFIPLLPFFLTNKLSFRHSLVIEAKENYFIVNRGFERLYVHMKSHTYDVGDILYLEGERVSLSFSTIESQFDFKDYLNRKGIYYELEISNITTKTKNPLRINAYRNYVLNKFSNESKSLVGSILFSVQDDSSILDNYQSLHMMRLISMSGIYLQLFMKFIKWLLNKKFKEKTSSGISLILLGIYLIFTFPRFAVIRVFLFNLFFHLNKFVFKEKLSYLNLLSILGLGLLIIDPFLALQDSYILGFFIPLFLYFIRPIIHRFKKNQQKLLSLLAIFIFFIPFELKYYNSVSLLSPIFQIILFPIFAIFAFSALLVFYGLPIQFLTNWINKPITYLGSLLSKMNLEIYAPKMNEEVMILYYFVLLIVVYLLIVRVGRYKMVALSLPIISLLFYFLPIDHLISEEISFINVGQGDATLIRKKNATFLIDTGGLTYLDVAKTSLIPYLKKKQIYHLDYVFITHHDYDHYGALDSLKMNYKINHIVANDIFPLAYQGITFTNYNHYQADASEENDRSLVLGFNLGKQDYLIMGDASKNVEKKIIKDNVSIPCDVLKVGHHGSKTSSSEEFISFLSPKKAIISCGYQNRFGHPNQEVVTILKKYHIKIYRTDYMGTINFKCFC